ncbi:MAG: aminodeoxychorismate synthase component I, partial [Pedobacter sp.]
MIHQMKIEDLNSFKVKALSWANTFDVCCYLDSNNYADPYGRFDFIIAAGARDKISINAGHAFESLKKFYEANGTWMFGLLGYDLKNETEQLSSSNADGVAFPDLYFFIPEYLITCTNGILSVELGAVNTIDIIEHFEASPIIKSDLEIKSKLTKIDYLHTVEQLQLRIARGDIYEANFCQEFFAEHAVIDPLSVYRELTRVSPVPFSGFFKMDDKFVLCASPERFICKRANKLISQPIKGTARRSEDQFEDEKIRNYFSEDVKEQAENVMIVDLVRN